MGFFEESMKALTDEVQAGTQQRFAVLGALKDHTARILSDAQSFVGRVHQEHQAMATHFRSNLAANRRERFEHVQENQRSLREDFQAAAKTWRSRSRAKV